MKAKHFHKRDGNSLESSTCILQAEQYTSSLHILFLIKNLGASETCNHVYKGQTHVHLLLEF